MEEFDTGGVPGEGLLNAPTFGSVLRRIRDARGVSRERLAFNSGVSASYVNHLEKGERERPTREVVTALMRYLDRLSPLAPEEFRQLSDLAGIDPVKQPSTADLRADLGRGIPKALALYEPHLAAYVDTRLNILMWNDSFAAGFPGLPGDGNLLRWMLGDPRARDAMVEWERELRISIQWLHGYIAQHGDTSWFGDLLQDLSRFPLFLEIWSDTTARYERTRPVIQLRDDAGRKTQIIGQLFNVNSTAYPGRMQIFIGLRTNGQA
ncbi:MmyB family transcriptional regulator [Nocardia tengchongensis]|uniref:MmyB family transcriptional regulator n=1 Tax=Nocardia tengchongensis TaxID=2055889 RepID=UPI003677DF66